MNPTLPIAEAQSPTQTRAGCCAPVSGSGAGRGKLEGYILTPGGTSETIEWPTPAWLYDALDAEFGFTLDPCSTHQNAKCPKHFTREDNGLIKSWANEVVWMNPPYGREIGAWMAKAWDAVQRENAIVVALVPVRSETDWWHRFAMKSEVRLIRRRLIFEGATAPAPFPSALVVMRPPQYRLVAWDAKQPNESAEPREASK